jgi:DNA-binding IclR family transcriptional regulator
MSLKAHARRALARSVPYSKSPLMAGKPARGLSLGFEVLLYFSLNIDDTLSAADIATKFGRQYRYVYADLKTLVDRGYLRWAMEKPSDRARTYSIGPELLVYLARYGRVT